MLDYNKLFAEQPNEVRQQLPERLRDQLEAGTDYLVLDENEFHNDLVRLQAVDFAPESGGSYSLKFRLQMKVYPDWDDNGPNEDEEGDTFFTRMTTFTDEDGNENEVEDLPGENNRGYAQGFKSYKITLDDLLEAELIDDSLYEYLEQQAEKWTQFVLDNGGNTQAPYQVRDENNRSMINKLSGLVTCDYMDFALGVRSPIQYGNTPRYGIDDINIEGLRRLGSHININSYPIILYPSPIQSALDAKPLPKKFLGTPPTKPKSPQRFFDETKIFSSFFLHL